VIIAAEEACQRAVSATYAVLPSWSWWSAFAISVFLNPYLLSQTILKQCSLIQANVLKQYSRQLSVDRRNPYATRTECSSPAAILEYSLCQLRAAHTAAQPAHSIVVQAIGSTVAWAAGNTVAQPVHRTAVQEAGSIVA
jgi:hypothetical protein